MSVKLFALRVSVSGELTVVMAAVVDAHSVSGSIMLATNRMIIL